MNSRYDPCNSPTLTWIKHRTAAGFAFLAPLTALAPAHAGGDPGYPVGGATVDERATLSLHSTLRLSGTYWCEGVGDRLGMFTGDVRELRGDIVAEYGLTGLDCGGAERVWQLDVAALGALPGRLWTAGLIMVCESADGPCPGKLFEGILLATLQR